MIDHGNDVVAYVDYEENRPVELVRGFSDVAVLHKDDLIFKSAKINCGMAPPVCGTRMYVSKIGALHACRLKKCRW